jgi:putative sterol carrier protein
MGVEAIVQFEISGQGGYQGFLKIEQGDLSLFEGVSVQPTVTVKASSEDWWALINGDENPLEMFVKGSVQVSGSLEIIASLVDAFNIAPLGIYRAEKWRVDIDYLGTAITRYEHL